MSKKKTAPGLSAADEAKIAAGEFYISEIETLRLQRLDALSSLWGERAGAAQAKAGKYADQLRAEMDKLKRTYELTDAHGIDLGDNIRGRIFASALTPRVIE